MPLLAKSTRRSNSGQEISVSLLQHTLDVLEAAETIFGSIESPGLLGEAWLRFFKVPTADYPTFFTSLRVAVLFHDWGKANSDFQMALQENRAQLFRHEWLSAILLNLDSVRNWLTQIANIDYSVVLSAVACHHLKFPQQADSVTRRQHTQWDDVTFLADEADHRSYLEVVAKILGIHLTTIEIPKNWSAISNAKSNTLSVQLAAEDLGKLLNKLSKSVRADDTRSALLSAVRTALMVADAAGSGLRRNQLTIKSWLTEAFSPRLLLNPDDIQTKILDPRIEQITKTGLSFEWNQFQNDCGNPKRVPSRSLLLAPCGSGKTLAAWRWVQSTLAKYPARRVLFLYPTRATAREGFNDYVSWAPECDASLMSGSSSFDLEDMFVNPDDPRAERDYQVEKSLYAIGFWNKRVFSSTVDQFLAFVANNYSAMCLLPVLADSIIIVDEIHSFDRAMFSALQELLKKFNVPVLCMTASLQNERQLQLTEDCQLTLYNERPDDLAVTAGAPRYEVARSTEAEALSVVQLAVSAGQRVLWVCNTVKRAQGMFKRLQSLHPNTHCYHSRYRLRDRLNRHKNVVSKLRTGLKSAIAVTTQVCEMSLDLDADVLVTEECPIPSLIQRMGRTNRVCRPRAESGTVLLIKPDNTRPYKVDELIGLDPFIDELAGRRVSQTDLEIGLSKHFKLEREEIKWLAFLKQHAYASSGEEFREIEQFASQGILDADLEDVKAAQKERKPTDGWILPIPHGRQLPDKPSGLPPYLRMASSLNYSETIGLFEPEPTR